MRVEMATEGGFPMTHQPMRVEMDTEDGFSTTRQPMRGEAASEGDFLMTRRPMRVEAASEGDFLTLDKKKIERNARLGVCFVGRLGRHLVVILGSWWSWWSSSLCCGFESH